MAQGWTVKMALNSIINQISGPIIFYLINYIFFRDIKYVLAHNAIFIYLATNFAADLLCFHLIFLGKLFQMISACRLFLWGPWIMEDLFQLSVLLSSVLRSRPISWLLIFRHSALGHLLVYRTMPEIENYNNDYYR